jgi:hypothetical protein
MNLSPIQQPTGVVLEADHADLLSRAKQLNAPRAHSTEAWRGKEAPKKPKDGLDLGAILGDIFSFIGKAFGAVAPTASHRDETKVGVEEKVEVAGRWSEGGVTAEGRAAAEAHARAQASSECFVDETGAGVRGGVEASVGASAEAAGRVCSDAGSIGGRARVSAEAYARLYGEARAGADGLSAAGKAEAGALAKAEAEVDAELLGGLVAGTADGRAEAGAGAQATARTAVTFNPPEAVIDAKAGAFAGARAGFKAKGGVAGVGYGIEAEVWSGAGAKAEITGGLDDGKFKFRATLGVAVGVGACVTIDLEIDTKDLVAMASGVLAAVGKLVGGVFEGVGQLAAGVVNGVAGGQAGQALDRLWAPLDTGSVQRSQQGSMTTWTTEVDGEGEFA